jgi:transcriptional regulator with XRE-family HTH domain
MSINDELASKLKRLIQDTPHLSQKIVAARAGISESYLSCVLSIKRRAHIDLLEEVANICGISLQVLIPPSNKSQEPSFGALMDDFEFTQLNNAEKHIITLYRRLNDKRKKLIIDLIFELSGMSGL